MGMKWYSFEALNKEFGISGPDGYWDDGILIPNWGSSVWKGQHHTEEAKESIRQARTNCHTPWCDEARKRRSEMQLGKKRGPYKTTKVRLRDSNGRFLPDK